MVNCYGLTSPFMLKFGDLVVMATVLKCETFKGSLGHEEHELTNITLSAGCSEERRLAWFVAHMLTDYSVFYNEMKKKKHKHFH